MLFRPEAGNLPSAQPPTPSESISTLPKSGLISFAFGFVNRISAGGNGKGRIRNAGKENSVRAEQSGQFSSFPAFLTFLLSAVRHSEQKCQSSSDRGTSHPVN